MESFGLYLKREREMRNISLDEISHVIKVSSSKLEAIENDDLSLLPALPFVKGFIKAYAQHIGLDPDDTVLRFEQYLRDIEAMEEKDAVYKGLVSKKDEVQPDYSRIVIPIALIVFFFAFTF